MRTPTHIRATTNRSWSGSRPGRSHTLLGLARWCISHRRTVVIGWIAIAILTS